MTAGLQFHQMACLFLYLGSICTNLLMCTMLLKLSRTYSHYIMNRASTRRAKGVGEQFSTLDADDVCRECHFCCRCCGNSCRRRRCLWIPRRVWLVAGIVCGRLRLARRVVIVRATWHWCRWLTAAAASTCNINTNHHDVTNICCL